MGKFNVFRHSVSVALVLGFLMGAAQAQAEPYAPVYSVPDGIESAALYRQQAQRISEMVPSRDEVEVPPYPGAVVFLVHPEEEVRQMIGTGGFAEIKLLTADSEDQIIAFYTENLVDWHFHEDFSIFWYGQPEFDLGRLMQGKPHITIQPAGSIVRGQVPDAEHMISIVYRSPVPE